MFAFFIHTVGTRAGRKAFVIGVALILMHELCGCFTMLNYTALIFRESGSGISPNLSAIIVGFIQLLGTYVATFLVDRIGRKILLTFSAIGTAICLACLGAYSLCNSIGINVKEHSWISIASFSGMMFLAACGIVPLMFVVIAEVMPEKVKSLWIWKNWSSTPKKVRTVHAKKSCTSLPFPLSIGSKYRLHDLFLSLLDPSLCHGEILRSRSWCNWHAWLGILLCRLYNDWSCFHHHRYTRNERQNLCRNCGYFGSLKAWKWWKSQLETFTSMNRARNSTSIEQIWMCYFFVSNKFLLVVICTTFWLLHNCHMNLYWTILLSMNFVIVPCT